MAGPVYVFYELRNFYQNHRLYAKSLNSDQLKGNSPSQSTLESDCYPIIYNRDLYINYSITNKSLDPNATANPCGLVAYTVFNDSFSLGDNIQISDFGIAWPSDLQKYKITNPDEMWTNTTDERFMNWMRIAAMPTFRKLWGRIDNGLPSGNYTLSIENSKEWVNARL